LQIRDVYPEARIRLFSIPDPPRSVFFHPGSASKNLSILTHKKYFLSSMKYLGCSYQIPYPDPYFLPILDPVVKRHWFRIRNTGYFGFTILWFDVDPDTGSGIFLTLNWRSRMEKFGLRSGINILDLQHFQ
jgi:hypothetical protein